MAINPKKTISDFWKETVSTIPGKFQILKRDTPTIVIDNAYNIDSLENLLLGIRLLHYKQTIEGLTIIIGAAEETFNYDDFLKAIRYFFKKTPGHIILCEHHSIHNKSKTSWDSTKMIHELKELKVKAHTARNFQEAFTSAKATVNAKNGLIVIAGPSDFIAEYWNNKGIKKL